MPKSANNVVFAGYFPVLHRGYLDFFDRHQDVDSVFVFDKDIIKLEDYLRKDLRALNSKQQVDVLGKLGRFKKVSSVTVDGLKKLARTHKSIIFPDDDISRSVSKELPSEVCEFDVVFLRWDRRSINKEDPVDPSRVISEKTLDRELMGLAKNQSMRSSNIWRRVGAVIAKDGKVLLKNSNHHMPTDYTPWIDGDPRSLLKRGSGIDMTTDMHAEAKMIADAARDGISLQGASIYVTTFPCPLCTKLIAEAGFSKCYYAYGYTMLDAQDLLKAYGVELIQVEVEDIDTNENEWVPYPRNPDMA